MEIILSGGEEKSSFFFKRIKQVKITNKIRIRHSRSGDK
jgi:hypothetical protein